MRVASTSAAALLRGDAIAASDGSPIGGLLYLPEYQRPYRWAEKQLAKLLDDLRRFFTGDEPAHHYYLGSVILHQQRDGEGNWRLNIIDGQQRLTTLALLAHRMELTRYVPDLRYGAPESQDRIRANLRWLECVDVPTIDYNRINVTLVVTRSEDDAYRFFETQNTGGVRLGGADIIKAHHLRAVMRERQDEYATMWEDLGDLRPLVDAVMKNRRWQALRFVELSSYRERTKVRDEIVEELAAYTGNDGLDHAFREVRFTHGADGWSQHLAARGYAMRQPLNAGVNTIHFLRYFHALRQQLLVERRAPPDMSQFHEAYDALAVRAEGSAYLHKLYDAALLLYASQFGSTKLLEASLWLFRAVYSPRLSNERVVRESTVQKFARESKLLDWIFSSYSHEELLAFLKSFDYKVDPSNLSATDNGVKIRYARAVQQYLGMPSLPADGDAVSEMFDRALCAAITKRTGA